MVNFLAEYQKKAACSPCLLEIRLNIKNFEPLFLDTFQRFINVVRITTEKALTRYITHPITLIICSKWSELGANLGFSRGGGILKKNSKILSTFLLGDYIDFPNFSKD